MFGKKKQPTIKSLIAQGTQITGDLRFNEGLRIDGEITGDVSSDPSVHSLLVVSETAHIVGAITANHIIINGRVDGPVKATELLELQPKANIEGDVHYKALEMHQGAVISGQLMPMNGAEKPALKLAANNG